MVIINMHCCEQHLNPEIYTVIPVTIQINAAKFCQEVLSSGTDVIIPIISPGLSRLCVCCKYSVFL